MSQESHCIKQWPTPPSASSFPRLGKKPACQFPVCSGILVALIVWLALGNSAIRLIKNEFHARDAICNDKKPDVAVVSQHSSWAMSGQWAGDLFKLPEDLKFTSTFKSCLNDKHYFE